MGWGVRLFAAFVGLTLFALGAWPLGLVAFIYVALSFRRPRVKAASVQKREVFAKPGHPWGRYAVGAFLLLLGVLAADSGGTFSPYLFSIAGLAVFFWPWFRRPGVLNAVVPVRDSVLLRSRLFPLSWHALAEVKLESQEQTRGVASMSGRLLLFSGKSPSFYQVVSAYALGYKQAEDRITKKLRQQTKMLSQRGAHLLPADSAEAASRLALELRELRVGTDDFEAVSSLPFDSAVFQVEDGRLVSHRAFSVLEPNGSAAIPIPDLKHLREPLFAEVVQEIGDKHGWPPPDEFSPFLASLDASRTEPFADRFQMRGEAEGRVTVETPGGAQVKLTRAQLRALARIYA